jgi:DnaJ-domain-containing protein 1
MAKYLFAPEMDKEIQHIYSINTDNKPRVINLAKKFNMPRWAVYQRALKIGAVTSSHQKRPWAEEEIKILENYARYEPQTIRKKLAKAGYERSTASIVLKRKRMRFLSNLKGMSAYLCAEFLGVDLHWVLNHINTGSLKAEVIRRDREGKANYFIREKDLRRFIITNPDRIDLRKVEKYYFIELVANGAMH